MKRLIMAASKIMVTSGKNETINDIVHLSHSIRLRRVLIVKKAFI